MYAIVEIAGKQYRVQKDDLLYIPLRKEEENKKVTFDRVLLVSDGAEIAVGKPVVEGAEVEATVVEHVKADKVLVFKKKRRKRYRVKRGHRQPYTRIKVDAVSMKSPAKKSKASVTSDTAPVEEKAATKSAAGSKKSVKADSVAKSDGKTAASKTASSKSKTAGTKAAASKTKESKKKSTSSKKE